MGKYYTDPATGQRVEIQKTHKFRNFVVLPIAGLFAVGIIATAANNGGATQQPQSPVPVETGSVGTAPSSGPSSVEITGNGQAMVGTMTDGYTSNTVTLPTTQQLPPGYVSVTVTRSPSVESYRGGGQGDSGTISCKMVRDGKVVDTKTATGQFASVTCSKMY